MPTAQSRPAHPRSRGENGPGSARASAPVGSSPLTRGKRQKWSVVRIARRLIPAHAGKTARHVCVLLHGGAHPRSRGENEMITGTRGASAGSSPLTRGKPFALVSRADHSRLIPAHAGKTMPRCLDHCGSAGSSPLTRGKQSSSQFLSLKVGLIPAHAGKTLCLPRGTVTTRAHPRSRGENQGGPLPDR